MTTAVAILDSQGNVLDVYSRRDMTRAEIIKHILDFGNPVIISSDVKIVPKSVEKIAVKFGSIAYSPDDSLSINEKKELTRDYYHLTRNDHEVDALSSAIKAWKHHRSIFEKVYKTVEQVDKKDIFADVMVKVLKEESPNIEDAIHELEKDKLQSGRKVDREKPVKRELLDKLQKNLRGKQQEIDSLQKENILLSKALNEAKREISNLQEKTLVSSFAGNRESKEIVTYFKALRKIENKGYFPVVEFGEVNSSLIDQMHEKIDLEGRVVLVKDMKNISLLNNRNIKCALTFNEMKVYDIEHVEFPVIQIDKNALEDFDNIKAIKIDYIEKELDGKRKSGLIEWLRGYKKRRE